MWFTFNRRLALVGFCPFRQGGTEIGGTYGVQIKDGKTALLTNGDAQPLRAVLVGNVFERYVLFERKVEFGNIGDDFVRHISTPQQTRILAAIPIFSGCPCNQV